jgi:hypothetical protein
MFPAPVLQGAVGLSFLGGDPVCNVVILGLRDDAPRHQFAGFDIGDVCSGGSHARQTQQLLSCGSVQIEWLVAPPASLTRAATAVASPFTSAVACEVGG